jgi:hypothetical protein
LCSPQSSDPILPIRHKWPWIELLPRSHDLSACNRPHLPAHLSLVFSLAAFRIRSHRMLNRSSDNPICRSHVGRYRPFSSQISLDQGARLLLEPNCVGKLTGKPLTRKSSAAQPGRSQPRRCEAFLRLARTHRIEALPRQSLHS